MKLTTSILFCVFAMNFGFAQKATMEFGGKFAFDTKLEKDPEFVMVDNYNHYLLSNIVTDGIAAKRQMIVRKFDQKNVLVDTYIYDFPKFDISTLYNYLGYTDENGKVAVFTQTYSNKAKKSSIVKHEFDKATNQFTSTEIFSTPILSAMKSGTVLLRKSDNGRYVGINYSMYQAKDEPEKNTMLMLDGATSAIAWQKEFSFADKFVTRTFAVTNSGKAVYLRDSKGMKKSNYLVLATADAQQQMDLETEITLQEPKSISIGTQDYILAFNSPVKGIRRGDYTNLLLFDLATGKTIQNAAVGDFNAVKDITAVEFRNIFIQNDEIQIYAEAKWKVKAPLTTNTVGNFGNAFPEDVYRFGSAYEIKLTMDGKPKSANKLPVEEDGLTELYHSLAIVNIMGANWINTGYHYYPIPRPNQDRSYYQYEISPLSDLTQNQVLETHIGSGGSRTYVRQLMHYFPDSQTLLLARTDDEKEMQLINAVGIK